MVLANQIIQRWKFSVEYGSDRQRRQAGISTAAGKRRWLDLRTFAVSRASSRPSNP
jgi:hypothetical protein